jgi:hypothetical protein
VSVQLSLGPWQQLPKVHEKPLQQSDACVHWPPNGLQQLPPLHTVPLLASQHCAFCVHGIPRLVQHTPSIWHVVPAQHGSPAFEQHAPAGRQHDADPE